METLRSRSVTARFFMRSESYGTPNAGASAEATNSRRPDNQCDNSLVRTDAP